jgi:phage tail-like protein
VARSIDSDVLLSYQFGLVEIPVPAPLFPVAFPVKAGQSAISGHLLSFQSIEVPSMTLQTKRIQEGNWPFMHQVPMGFLQTGQVKIRQAVTAINFDFFLWFTQAIYGLSFTAPRRNFAVVQTRADRSTPVREILLWDCIPVEWKPTSTLDAARGDISIEELTMECNRVEILPGISVT